MPRIAIPALFSIFPSLAIAHPDHLGSEPTGLTHLLTDPFHVGVTLIIDIPLVWLVARLRRRADPSA